MKKNSRVIIYKEYRDNISSNTDYSFIDKNKDPTLSKKIDLLLKTQDESVSNQHTNFKNNLIRFKKYCFNYLFFKKNKIRHQLFFYFIILLLGLTLGIFVVLVLTGVIK